MSTPLLIYCFILILFGNTLSLMVSPLRMWSPNEIIKPTSEYGTPRKKYGLSSNYRKGIAPVVPLPALVVESTWPVRKAVEVQIELPRLVTVESAVRKVSAPSDSPAADPTNEACTLKQRLLQEIKSRSLLKVYRTIDELKHFSLGNDKFVGNWQLVFADDDKTRASPFFWAFKQAFQGTQIPKFIGVSNFAEGVFLVTDSIPSALKKIGTAKQYVSSDGKLVSQIEIISPIGKSLMTTTSLWSALPPSDCDTIELRVQKTQVLESTVQKLLSISASSPLLSGFPSGAALELASPGSSTVLMSNLYLDDSLRISRSPDDKIFVFERIPQADRPVGL